MSSHQTPAGSWSGANVQQADCTGDAAQQWRPVATPGGAYILVNLGSSLVLEVAGGSTADRANVAQGTYSGAVHQLWTLTVR